MINMLRKFMVILLVFILLFTSGCWNRREIDTLTINTAIGIDHFKTDGKTKILLSVLTLKPSPGSGDGEKMNGGGTSQQQTVAGQVISITGDTIVDAVRNWGQQSSRQLFMGHTVLFVISESVAREGIGWVIDFCTRNRDIPERAMVVVCEGMARDCLQAQPEFETQLSTEIFNILTLNQFFTAKTRGTDIITMMYDLLTPGREASTAFLKPFTPPEKGSTIRQTPQADEEKGEQPQQKVANVSGVVVFRGEKLAGRLNELETQGMLFIIGETRGGVIPVAFDSTEKNTSYLFRDVNTKVKPLIEKDEITFQVEIKGTGELIGAAPETIDITKESDIKIMENMISQEVEHRCRIAVIKTQKLRSDVFGFGDILHRTQPEVWREIENRWEEIFPYVEVDITADFSVEHSGLIGKSLEIR
ncbi:MAG: Ger(x)C family spore germination protein [Syntrophaceticus sp.]|nr:Ger(x)C family spore germination protein [Syntrophaceticus sp.]